MKKNYLSRAITTLLLTGALTATSVSPTEVEAKKENKKENNFTFYMNGIYTHTSDGETKYVYLGNKVPNYNDSKNEALEIVKGYFSNPDFYVKEKLEVVKINGTNVSYKKVKMYAVSEGFTTNGWTRIDASDVPADAKVATSMELGDLLLNKMKMNQLDDLQSINYDLNNDGIDEKILISNGGIMDVVSYEEAIKYAEARYLPYFVLYRYLRLSNQKLIKVYAISGKGEVEGWHRMGDDDVPRDAKICLSTKYYDVQDKLYDELLTLRTVPANGKVEEIEPIEDDEFYDEIDPDDSWSYKCKLKDDFIQYKAKKNHSFFILSKVVKNPQDPEDTLTIYASSPVFDVKGWDIAASDDIAEDEYIFYSIKDARNYYYSLRNNKVKKYILR